MQHWHLLMTKPREDERAQQHLLNQGYELFRPLLRQYQVKNGKQVAVEESLFPRYIFIRLDDVQSNWAKIRSTRGVAKMVRFTDLPAIVPEVIISELKGQCNDVNTIDITKNKPYVYQMGDEIQVTEGSFKGIQALIKKQVAEDRVLLLMNILGKEQELEIPLNQIKSLD